jgi:hypothetical protein
LAAPPIACDGQPYAVDLVDRYSGLTSSPQKIDLVFKENEQTQAGAARPRLVVHCAMVPSTPTNLQANESGGGNSVALTWTAGSGSSVLEYYEVWRSLNDVWSVIGTASATSTTYSDMTITPSQILHYIYKVRAVDTAGQLSAYSNIAGPDHVAPSTPSGLTATPINNSRIGLSWTASTDNGAVTGYRIERCQGSGCSNFAEIATVGATTSYTNIGLSIFTSYSYRVRAFDVVGNLSGYSPVGTAVTLAELLNIDNTGLLTAEYSAYADDVFYLQSPNGTNWRVTVGGTTGAVTNTDGLTGSPVGRAVIAPNNKIWDFSVTNDGVLIVTERP